jgi:hypothetical protein
MHECFCKRRSAWLTYQTKLLTVLVGLILSTLALAPASAETFALVDLHKKRIALAIGGVITSADAEVVDSVLQLTSRAHRPVKVILFSSPGGEFLAGLEIAGQVHRLGLPVLVRGECLSACAFIALAARKLTLSGRARVGVHQSYGPSGDSDLRATRFAAQLLRGYGASGSAILKMLDTPPGRIAILSHHELHAQRVR